MRGKLKKQQKGITLIALVITIIVLLILAGVSIAMLTGDNGILTQAQRAKEQTEKSSVIEQVQVDILGEQAKGDGSGITSGVLQTILNKYFSNVPEDSNSITTETILTAKEEYGGYDIPLSDMYTGEIIAEKELIETTTSYVGCFADMNPVDGVADGIIYADLAVGGSGSWGSNGFGTYSIPTKTGLKEYYIENENYTESKFGNKSGKLIAPLDGTSGEDRFYIMALEDINEGTKYYWYYSAYGKLDRIVEEADNDFGQGKENTAYVMKKWNTEEWGIQNYSSSNADVWGAIRTKVSEGWFVPSKSEWCAFGDMITETMGISNYTAYKLSDQYWLSSQYSKNLAYYANLTNGYVANASVKYGNYYVRLSATF